MSEPWFFLNSGQGDPSWNMALDEALLEHVQQLGRPVLRLYGWAIPAATFGYFQKYSDVTTWTHIRPLIRRPTAGGLVPHLADWTYSLVFPPEHHWFSLRAEESYQQAHEWIADSLAMLRLEPELAQTARKELPGQCFIGAEKFDVLAGGKKIAGAAQKRNRSGLLIQGSVQWDPPQSAALKRVQWEQAMLKSGRERRGILWAELRLPPPLIDRAAELDRAKYSTAEYNYRR